MNTKISLLKIVEDTVVDGPGFRLSLYAAGCPHHCHGCHNPHSWQLSAGESRLVETILAQVLEYPSNLTFSGGDPLLQVEAFTLLAKEVKHRSKKTIWCFTGYLYEEILKSERLREILPYLDVLVDGPFLESQRDPELIFKGSSNQRIIDVPESLKRNQVVLFEYEPLPQFS